MYKYNLLEHVNNLRNDLVVKTNSVMVPISKYDGSILNRKVYEFAHPHIARNNCYAVSQAVLANFDFTEYFDDAAIEVAGIESPAGNHYGILISQESSTGFKDLVVIDFSARQYDVTMPFPLIMDAWKWQEWVEEKLGRFGTWSNDDSWDLG